MAETKATDDQTESRPERFQPRPSIEQLSDDFLRLTASRVAQEEADHQTACALQEQEQRQQFQPQPTSFMAPNVIGRLSITIAQAKLVRNYGLTRMDPYVRIRIGHFVYETQTDPNGGKNPHWNRVIHSQLPSGVQTIYVEVYDECSFKMDELIAWTEIRIGEAVLRGETHEDWYPLSGKQGDGVEGMLDVVMSFSPASAHQTYSGYGAAIAPIMVVPNVSGRPIPMMVAPHIATAQPVDTSAVDAIAAAQQRPVTPANVEADMKLITEMFMTLDADVVRSVYEANRCNKEATINSLLQITND